MASAGGWTAGRHAGERISFMNRSAHASVARSVSLKMNQWQVPSSAIEHVKNARRIAAGGTYGRKAGRARSYKGGDAPVGGAREFWAMTLTAIFSRTKRDTTRRYVVYLIDLIGVPKGSDICQ